MNKNRFNLDGEHGEFVGMLEEDAILKLFALCCKKCVREDLKLTTLLEDNPMYNDGCHYIRNRLTYLSHLVNSYNAVNNDFLQEKGLLGGTVTKITKRVPRANSNRALVKRGKRVAVLTDDIIEYCISRFDMDEKEILKYGNELIGERGVARTMNCWDFCILCMNQYFSRH